MFIAKVPTARDLHVYAEAKRTASIFGKQPVLTFNGYYRRLCGKSFLATANIDNATQFETAEELQAALGSLAFDSIKVEKRIPKKTSLFS